MDKWYSIFAEQLMASFGWGSPGFAQPVGPMFCHVRCRMCHGAKGKADAAAKSKPFKAAVPRKPDEAPLSSIGGGTGKLAACKEKLTDAQIREAFALIRKLRP